MLAWQVQWAFTLILPIIFRDHNRVTLSEIADIRISCFHHQFSCSRADLVAFRIELVAFNDRLVAQFRLLDPHNRKSVVGFIFSKPKLDK